MITETTLEAASHAFEPPLQARRRYRPDIMPLDPILSSRLYSTDTGPRLGITVMFGGRAYLGSVAVKGVEDRAVDADALAGLLEGIAAKVRDGR